MLPAGRASGLVSSDLVLKPGLARWIAALVCSTSLLMAGCSRAVEPPPFVAIEQEVSPDPVRVGPAIVAFKLSDAAGKPISNAHVAVEADMSHPGMQPRFAKAIERERGRYLAQLEFPMAGDWVILLHITLPDSKKVERQFDVRGVRAN
jgi:YtkA-like